LFADLNPTAVYRILELAFFAGVGWMTLKGLRKDVNGIGKKIRDQKESDDRRFREQKELEDRRFFSVSMILMASVKDEDRRLFARWLIDSNRGKDGA
jgi:hypothetical protein